MIWLTGILFEAIGDWQLLSFIRDPANKGRLMTGGLWRYTRHPNYFGEVTLWWGIYLIALSVPHGWMTVVGPLTITLLILKVSGIPMLEKSYEGRPDFQEYKRRTSAFFPLPPRS
jgi:steroid 5-alpha reductase family enzyme